MSIGKFISRLLPNFKRSRVEEELTVLIEDLNKNTIPPFESASEFFNTNSFFSKDNKEFNSTIYKRLATSKLTPPMKTNYISLATEVLKNTYTTLTMLDNDIEKYFSTDISAGGITYSRANILKYIEVATFVNKYSRKLLLWTYSNENVAAKGKIPDPFSPIEIKWMHEFRNEYINSIRILCKEPKVIIETIKNIPNIIVVPNEVDVVEKTIGVSTIDPLAMGLTLVEITPAYLIGMKFVEWQASRYHAGVEEKRSLEYRLLSLKENLAGRHDAKLEREIEYTENRVRKLNIKLAKLEEV